MSKKDRKTFLTSDNHFNHVNIIRYCNRPFKNIYEMNEELIRRWNETVGPDDAIYHLGDFFLGSKHDIKGIADRLNGRKYLIRGNHDRCTVKSYEDAGFTVLKDAPILLDKYKIALSHRPLPDSMFPKDFVNIHGHIHEHILENDYDTSLFSPDKHINVSVDVTDFKPVLLDDLLAQINELKNRKK